MSISQFVAARATGEAAVDKALQASAANWLLVAMAAVALAAPRFLACSKRYQHNGMRIANQHACAELPIWRMYTLCLKGSLFALVPIFLCGVVAAVTCAALRANASANPQHDAALAMPVTVIGTLAFYLFVFAVVGPYFAARIQNQVWGATRSESLDLVSSLRFRSLLWLTLRNGPWWF